MSMLRTRTVLIAAVMAAGAPSVPVMAAAAAPAPAASQLPAPPPASPPDQVLVTPQAPPSPLAPPPRAPAAQAQPAVPRGAKPPTPPTPPAPPAPQEPSAPLRPAPPRQLVNIQVELTITDQMGDGTPEKKVVSLIASDGHAGRIRASVAPGFNGPGATINVDARPLLEENGAIRLELTLVYQPLRADQQGDGPSPARPTELQQSLNVLLRDGQPLLVSQGVDPITDRRITVEAKATLMK